MKEDDIHWPEILVEGERETARRLEELTEAGVKRVDILAALKKELAGLIPTASVDLMEEPARWVYYPWRGVAVRVLGPRAFDRIRLDRNRNKLTAREQAALRRRCIAVVGLSVGSASALLLAREGLCGALRLADFDHVELSNLNRVEATLLDLGLNKAVSAARHVSEIDPYMMVQIEPRGVRLDTIETFLAGVDLIVEECDSLDVKLQVRKAARARRIPVLMETSDRGLLDVERFDIDPHRPLLHGLVDGLDPDQVAGLSTDEKVPYALRMLEPEQLSSRFAASLVEIDETVTTWPQLASDVSLGASVLATAVRRIFLAPASVRSGRTRIDLQAQLDALTDPSSGPSGRLQPPCLSRPALSDDLTEALVEAARWAPSGGNVQPWRISANEERLEIRLDPDKSTGMDIGHRGSLVALGAALLNARLVADARGARPRVEIDTSGGPRAAVARLWIADDATHRDPRSDVLADLVPHRVSNRHYGDAEPLPADQLRALREDAVAEGGDLVWLDGDRLEQIVPLWVEADRLRYLTPRLHREMMSELRRPGLDDLSSGIDLRTLELSPSDLAKIDVARRSDVMAELRGWNGGARLGEDTAKRLRSASGLAVVTCTGTEVEDYVRGGMATERVWLRAQALGLGVQPMSPVFLYGVEPAELTQVAGAERGAVLMELRARFLAISDIPPSRGLALTMRVSRVPPPTALSLRASDVHVDHR